MKEFISAIVAVGLLIISIIFCHNSFLELKPKLIPVPCEKFLNAMTVICNADKNDVCRVAQMKYLKCIKDSGEKLNESKKTQR